MLLSNQRCSQTFRCPSLICDRKFSFIKTNLCRAYANSGDVRIVGLHEGDADEMRCRSCLRPMKEELSERIYDSNQLIQIELNHGLQKIYVRLASTCLLKYLDNLIGKLEEGVIFNFYG